MARVLTGCDVLFVRYFRRWYAPERLARRPYAGTRPDVEVLPAALGVSAAEYSPLAEAWRQNARKQIGRMVEAAAADWAEFVDAENPVSIDGLHAFDKYYGRPEVAALIRRSDPRDFSNDYLVLCCELGSVIGDVLRSLDCELEWVYDWPYWESAVWHKRTGSQVNVFDWAVKKLSSYGVSDGLRPKLLHCWSTLPKDDRRRLTSGCS